MDLTSKSERMQQAFLTLDANDHLSLSFTFNSNNSKSLKTLKILKIISLLVGEIFVGQLSRDKFRISLEGCKTAVSVFEVAAVTI